MKLYLPLLFFVGLFMTGCSGTEASASPEDTVVLQQMEREKRFSKADIVIEKDLLYDQYTLKDTYPYRDTVRYLQFDKMRDRLFLLDSIQIRTSQWAVLQNRGNNNGEGPLVKEWVRNAYKRVSDLYDVERYQSVPLYIPGDSIPERYGRDGSLVKFLGENPDSATYRVESYNAPGIWDVPKKYVTRIEDTVVFRKAIMIDRHNQNISTLEKVGDKWLVRSMNPATTGVHNPPYAHETPEGMFVVQEKKVKMYYLVDGTSRIAGYAPWASRFCNGAYVHGVPTNNPNAPIIEYSWTLGSIPRSHMCVRNASSHAEFVFNWAPVFESIVFVYE